MFFSVDVETTALTPWEGELLTVGIIPVTEDGIILEWKPFHIQLNYLSLPAKEAVKAGVGTDTDKFWASEDIHPEAYEAAWGNRYRRISFDVGALQVTEYLYNIEPEWSRRIFVANPASFDKMWIDYLFALTQVANPFHYRSLCLRSMKYGMVKDPTYGSDRTNHTPDIPHHALSDAIAQAKDLVKMLDQKVDVFVD